LGHDLAVDRRGARREIGLLGHDTGCYDDLTVRENLRFAARAAGRDAAASDAALERVGLTAQADVVHGRLSAGQRRRLALAVTLARDPRLLLLDEPHAGLDAAGRAVLDAVVASSPAEGRTVLLASHELDRARALANREVVLAGGVTHFGVAAPGLLGWSHGKTESEKEAVTR
jgi:ABC-type multidrug transport system ATPase subunit